MTLDMATFALTSSLASALHALVAVIFAGVVRKYRGIGTYAFGAVLSATGLLCYSVRSYSVRSFVPEWLILRLLGNLCVGIAPLIYGIGIAEFVGRPKRPFATIALATALAVSQLYLVYFDDSYARRNGSLTAFIAIAYGLPLWDLLASRRSPFRLSALFTAGTIAGLALFMAFRAIAVPLLHVRALFDARGLNTATFLVLFVADYLRSWGFLMMVSQRLYEDLNAIATVDELTQIPNRRTLQTALEKEFHQFQRGGPPFSIALLDLDRFKCINDTHGHDCGDAVLQQVAGILSASLRQQDTVGRWGGEEFLALLPGTTGDAAVQAAERLRQAIADGPAVAGQVRPTASIGVAPLGDRHADLESLLAAADRALYRAKAGGRNRVVRAEEGELPPQCPDCAARSERESPMARP